MPCNNCGGALGLTASEGATNGGQFTEQYKCANCGGTGRIYGESSDMPSEWNKTGVCQ